MKRLERYFRKMIQNIQKSSVVIYGQNDQKLLENKILFRKYFFYFRLKR